MTLIVIDRGGERRRVEVPSRRGAAGDIELRLWPILIGLAAAILSAGWLVG